MLGAGWSDQVVDPRTGQIWPPTVDAATGAVIGSGVVSTKVVEAVPAVGRAMGVIAGRMAQMPLTLWSRDTKLATPRLFEKPDPNIDYPTWMSALVWDYFLHGNAVVFDTTVDDEWGMPQTAMWIPAEKVNAWMDPTSGQLRYVVGNYELDLDRVHHFRRRLDPREPWRGIGILEQYMRTFAKISDQQGYESTMLRESGVPSIAITVGNPDMSQAEAEAAKESWKGKFSGPVREPVVLPEGTTVTPLGWSPHDSEMVEAQKMSRGDVADLFNLDRYYLGVSDGNFNYKTAGTMAAALVTDTLGEHLQTFEAGFTAGWCMHGRRVKFDPTGVTADSPAVMSEWLIPLVRAGIISSDEARARLGFAPMATQQADKAVQEGDQNDRGDD